MVYDMQPETTATKESLVEVWHIVFPAKAGIRG
jgi:hypothetical protein